MKHKGWLQCSWRRDRGDAVCESTLRVRTDAAEACVLAAVREQALTPDNVAYAVERTLAEITKACAEADPVALRRKLEAFMVERNAFDVTPGIRATVK